MKARAKHVRPKKRKYTKGILGYWNGVPARIKREVSKKLEDLKRETK